MNLKTLLRLLLLVMVFFINACCDDCGVKFKYQAYEIENSSKHDATLFFHYDTLVGTLPLMVNENGVLGLFKDFSDPPFISNDSLIVIFDDNKRLVYDGACLGKSLMCLSSFECDINSNKDVRTCIFKLDELEYQKAK